ncbi:hypothetical protein [Lacimicrobium sp. SS2-24]|uniref:hypothetical protein n=1 Tax=Lacimicrobium sp. SS2-24 TaxID=2005569 RepID=UPI000B4BB014|nr:hypothetical protein [Lacimicrobium sp. SS2-24]
MSVEVLLTYTFGSEQQANRFINVLKNWDVNDVDARLHAASHRVQVRYQYSQQGFDFTCSALDDLAGEYGGSEDK